MTKIEILDRLNKMATDFQKGENEMAKFIGRLLCKLGFHRLEDSWCQRDGCNHHEVNC